MTMKFTFFVFLVVITGMTLFAPNLTKKTTGDITTAVKSFKEVTEAAQEPVEREKLETPSAALSSELGLSPDKQIVEVEVVAPVMDKLGQVIPKVSTTHKNLNEIAEDVYLKKIETFKFIMSEYGPEITFIAVLIILFAFVSKWLDIYKLAYLFSRLGWFFSRFALMIFSLAAISIWFSLKKNLWLDAGSNLFFIPLQILVAASVGFKIMDSNFPIWNRLFASFILPLISGITTHAIRFF